MQCAYSVRLVTSGDGAVLATELLRFDETVRDVLRTGKMDPGKTCVTCSGCTQIMRDGTMTVIVSSTAGSSSAVLRTLSR